MRRRRTLFVDSDIVVSENFIRRLFEEMAVSIYEAMVRAKRLRKSAARSRGA